jgi:hypothetical protein
LPRPVSGVGDDDPAHRPTSASRKERQRFSSPAARFHQQRGTRAREAPLVRRQPPLRLLEQELAEEPVVVVGRGRSAAPVDEKMPPVEVIEQARRVLVTGQRDRFRLRERRRKRSQHQHALVGGLRAIEDLAGEVLEDRVLAFADRLVEQGAVAAQVLAQQHEGRHPAVALATDPLQRLRIERIAAQDGLGFGRACGAAGSIRAMRRLATRRANPAADAARDRDDGDASGTERARTRPAARCPCASWKLSRGDDGWPRQDAKNSRK